MDSDDRELRRLRLEQRELQEEVEIAAADQDAARRSLADAMLMLGNRSTEITVEVDDRDILGSVIHVADDLVSILTNSGASFDIALEAIGGVRYRANHEPIARNVSSGHPRTLLARLRELVVDETEAAVGRRIGPAVTGRVRAVSTTHLELIDRSGTAWLIPIGQISWLGPPSA